MDRFHFYSPLLSFLPVFSSPPTIRCKRCYPFRGTCQEKENPLYWQNRNVPVEEEKTIAEAHVLEDMIDAAYCAVNPPSTTMIAPVT